MKRQSSTWETLLIVTIVLLAVVCAQAQAAEVGKAEVGKVVQIAPGEAADDFDETQTRIVEAPTYWIGIHGRSIESAVLRTHLQLAQDMGVVVEKVAPESPAAKAGLRMHDIILRVNGDAVDNMHVLKSQVLANKEKPLELKIIRLGKQENIVVVPELLPESQRAAASRSMGRWNGRHLEGDALQQLLEQFGARNLDPGMILRGGQGLNFNRLPNGVSVSIQRNNDEPAQITVKQGDKTWQIEGDDEESLQQLPDDVRLYVERMLNGQNNLRGFGGAFELGDFQEELESLLPRGLDEFPRNRQPDRLGDPVLERMEQLERRFNDLNDRFNQKTKWKLLPQQEQPELDIPPE